MPDEGLAADFPAEPPGGVMAGARGTPYWWDDADVPAVAQTALPRSVDVAVVGSGYTGLNAALVAARGGRTTAVFEAGKAGQGCSTRNGGQISTSVKPAFGRLARRHGPDRARAVREEGVRALDWIEAMIAEEGIACGFHRAGRFHAAHTPAAYETLVRTIGVDDHAVPRDEQHREIGSDRYHGGVVHTRHAALHPAQYHAGLLERVLAAGVAIHQETPVTGIGRDRAGFRLSVPQGSVLARDVIVATNGYSGTLIPWISRRIIPIGSYIIATEPLPPDLIQRLFPTGRIVSDTRRVIYYYRASPDRRRVIFGGRVSTGESDPAVTGPRLHREMTVLFPELASARVSHSWMGMVAYSFDELAHTGVHDGIHYALSYCGSGVSMASYLGMRLGQKVLGSAEGLTAFDGLPFPTRPLYSGRPWFLPAVVAWYRWRDERECARAAARAGR